MIAELLIKRNRLSQHRSCILDPRVATPHPQLKQKPIPLIHHSRPTAKAETPPLVIPAFPTDARIEERRSYTTEDEVNNDGTNCSQLVGALTRRRAMRDIGSPPRWRDPRPRLSITCFHGTTRSDQTDGSGLSSHAPIFVPTLSPAISLCVLPPIPQDSGSWPRPMIHDPCSGRNQRAGTVGWDQTTNLGGTPQ